MGLHERRSFRTFCARLPGVTLHEQWEALVAKVGGKVFALRGDSGDSLVFKVSELGYEGLTSLDGIRQASYFAKGQWVNVGKDADLPDKDAKAYVREAHRIIARKLTRKTRATLGIDP